MESHIGSMKRLVHLVAFLVFVFAGVCHLVCSLVGVWRWEDNGSIGKGSIALQIVAAQAPFGELSVWTSAQFLDETQRVVQWKVRHLDETSVESRQCDSDTRDHRITSLAAHSAIHRKRSLLSLPQQCGVLSRVLPSLAVSPALIFFSLLSSAFQASLFCPSAFLPQVLSVSAVPVKPRDKKERKDEKKKKRRKRRKRKIKKIKEDGKKKKKGRSSSKTARERRKSFRKQWGTLNFKGFDHELEWSKFVTRWADKEDDPESIYTFLERYQTLRAYCIALDEAKAPVYCPILPEDKRWIAEFEDIRQIIDTDIAFGSFGIVAVVRLVPDMSLLSECKPLPGRQVTDCSTFNITKDRAAFGTRMIKFPVQDISWKTHHTLGRCKFWDPSRPKDKKYEPFPKVYDLDSSLARPDILVMEFFGEATKLHDLREFLALATEKGEISAELSKRVVMRCIYMYALWGIILLMHGFHHTDFHTGNIMIDMTQMKGRSYGNLTDVGMNHVYIIDLDTVELPQMTEQDKEDLHTEVGDNGQGFSVDSCSNIHETRVQVQRNGFDSLHQLLWHELYEKAPYCVGDRSMDGDPVLCSLEGQLKTVLKTAEVLWNYDIETKGQMYGELPSPTEVLKFKYKC